MMEIAIKERLKALRKERGETQVEVASAIDIVEQYYQKLEYGTNLPGLEIIWKLADHFGVSVDYLIGRSEER
ncbi:helix-turn-helix transcriptional regulator [Oscillospiraceae bacterium 38-13]